MTTAVSMNNGDSGWVAADTTFGARLALVRQRMAWGNVKEAALACGIPAQSWRTWERDGVSPRDYEAACQKISARTGCDYGWLAVGKPTGSAYVPPTPPTTTDHLGVNSGWRNRRAWRRGVIPLGAPTVRVPLRLVS